MRDCCNRELGERRQVSAAEFQAEPKERLVVALRGATRPLPSLRCPAETCSGQILGAGDTRLWRMLTAHVRDAHAPADFSGVVHVRVDEMNRQAIFL